MAGSRRMAQRGLQRLNEESGANAFRQRDFKGKLRSANRVSESLADGDQMMEMEMMMDSMQGIAPNTPAPAASAPSRFGGAGGGGIAGALSSNLPAADKAKELRKRQKSSEPIKRIGTKTFFLRAGRYVDSGATKEQIESAKTIEQFSDEYFALLKDLDDESKTYLAQEKEILVVIKKTTYIIKAPAKK